MSPFPGDASRRLKRRLLIAVAAALAGVFVLGATHGAWHAAVHAGTAAAAAQANPTTDAREAAYRANNLGVALLEQFRHTEGAEQFRRALALDPGLALAQINLAIALYNVPDAEGAARAATTAHALAPHAPQPHYITALVARARNQADEAVAAFRRVLEIDPQDTGANVNLGQLYAQARKYTEAERAFRVALDSEPYNTTALYGLANVLLRSGKREEGQQLLQQFQTLRQTGAGTSIGTNYLEQGRYAEALASTGAEAALVDRRIPEVTYTDATASVLSVAVRKGARGKKGLKARPSSLDEKPGAAVLFDYDEDGDLDLYDAAPDGSRLYRNDGGRYLDVTARSGALSASLPDSVTGAVAGDYDNDARTDLLLLNFDGQPRLYHNDDGTGKFSDATKTANIPCFPFQTFTAAFADVDHDGDLDIFIAGYKPAGKPLYGAPNLLLRNNGDGRFTDITAAAKVSASSETSAAAVVPTDYDNRRDVDLFVVNYGAPPALYRNMRDGTFRDVAREVGMTRRPDFFLSAAAGDVNKDGFTDFFCGQLGEAGLFFMSDGRGHFKTVTAPPGTEHALVSQFLDYDNDGLLDLLIASHGGVRLWRNVGDGWMEVSERAVAEGLRARKSNERGGATRLLLSGDVDGDGDTDFFVRDAATGRLRFARNEGGNRNRSLGVRLAGRVSNRGGVESKVEMRAGSLWQKLEVYAASPAPAPADLLFGLGRRERADAVRVLWPSGTVQAETEVYTASPSSPVVSERTKNAPPPDARASRSTLIVTELDRKPSSCPYLFAWNGERFEFVTDFMGGGELGYWVAPGVRAAPDPDEYVRIPGEGLKPRDGLYELRVTNELEEVLFMDRLQLLAVAHPSGTEIYPGEGLGSPLAAQFKLFAARAARTPRRAFDEHGHDVRARIAHLDRSYADDFTLESIRGYAAEHTLTLDLGDGTRARRSARKKSTTDTTNDERTLLLLTGWTDYAFSSDNVAAAQRGLKLRPPALQVKDARGRWRTVVEDIGVPVGRPQTVVVDLTGKFLSHRREVRIVTNMRIYWDRILLDTSGAPVDARGASALASQTARLDPVRADLRWRGFSAQVSPDGREPYLYDYARVSYASPWKVFTGRYTREGDVRDLLQTVDDMFVVSRPGDELSLAFAASALAPLPRGWTRTFLLYAHGYSKEMDINSASPEQVAPLPFRRMKEYPYRWPEAYPQSPAHLDYLERYNTRTVVAPLPELIGERGKGER